jgi:membrane protein
MTRHRARLSRITEYLQTGIWRVRLNTLPRRKAFFLRQARILLLSIQGFTRDACPLRASALTFYSLLSLVPVAAMAFGVAKGFGFDRRLEAELLDKFPGQQEVVVQVIGFAQSFLENTKGGLIAGIGLAVLFWTVLKVLGHIETSFNAIWDIDTHRSFGRKFGDYLSIMFVAPVLVLVSSSATVFITTQVTLIASKISLLGLLSPLIFSLLKLLPYGIVWVLFTVIYMLMPNTRVRLFSGMTAGIAAGTLYQITQWLYINFQVNAARYNAIYGSFAALPLFLIWLQISWLIVLLGAEISYAHQNVDAHEIESDGLEISAHLKRLVGLLITHCIVKAFSEGRSPLSATDLSNRLQLPIRLVNQTLGRLVKSDMVTRICPGDDPDDDERFQPAMDIHRLTVQSVIHALDQTGTQDLRLPESPEVKRLSDALSQFSGILETAPANRPLMDL